MIDNYILIGQTAVPCPDIHEWAEWFEHNDRRVALTKVMGFCYVSTVFLGLDHSFGHRFEAPELAEFAAHMGLSVRDIEPPILFESMTFWAGGSGEEQDRCATWAEAEEMHKRMVAEVARPRSVLGYVYNVLYESWSHAKKDWQERWREIRGLPRDEYDDPMMGEMMERMDARMAERYNDDWKMYG